jgi:hypothetical protein
MQFVFDTSIRDTIFFQLCAGIRVWITNKWNRIFLENVPNNRKCIWETSNFDIRGALRVRQAIQAIKDHSKKMPLTFVNFSLLNRQDLTRQKHFGPNAWELKKCLLFRCSSCSRYNANFKFDQSVSAIHDSPPYFWDQWGWLPTETSLATHARDHWWTLDFANAFVSPGVDSRAELVPSPRARGLNWYEL